MRDPEGQETQRGHRQAGPGGLGRFLILLGVLGAACPTFAADEIHWTVTGQTSVTLDWRGADSSVAEGTIQWGTSPGEYANSLQGATPSPLPHSSAGPFWEAKLTGLAENTLYYYKIGNNAERTFRTPPPRGTSGFVVVAAGDSGASTRYPDAVPVFTLIANESPDLVLHMGDHNYADGKGASVVDQYFNDIMVWSLMRPFMPAWGNHEWGNGSDTYADDLRNYKGRFDFPNSQVSPGLSSSNECPACGDDWYWFDYGNVRFVAIPEPYTSATYSDWDTKADAIFSAAQSDPEIDFIVTYGHRPAYTTNSAHSSNTQLRGILDGLGSKYSKYVIDLSGHNHAYERTDKINGKVHLMAGTGGAGNTSYSFGSSQPWSLKRFHANGVVKLRFSKTGVEGQFVCAATISNLNTIGCSSGEIADTFTIGSPTTDTTAPAAPQSLRVN